mgnify:CR=1 FL=1
MQDGKETVVRRMGRGWRIVLVVSLALNLLVVGIMAGGAFKHARSGAAGGAQTSELRALWWALPDAARRDLSGTMRYGPEPGQRAQSREERRAEASARMAQMRAMLRNEPFDAPGFATLLEQDRQARAQRIDRAHEAFVARLAQMSAEERAAVAERLGERRPRRFGRD